MPRPSTFSIVAYDPELVAWGIAVASKFPAAGAVVPWARAGAGAVATQSYANTSFGPDGLQWMAGDMSAPIALDALLEADEGRSRRQVGLVDKQGIPATFTGEDCYEWAGSITGTNYAVQGNILVGEQVVEAMAEAYEDSQAHFPDRLLQALLAGDGAGGDRRGRQSAALLAVKEEAGYGGFNDRWLDYRVDDDPEPIPRLMQLLELHELYFGESPEEDRLQLEGDVLESLQTLMVDLGYLEQKGSAELNRVTSSALRAFLGNENFEERVDLKRGWIDRPVYEFLLRRFKT